jgi:hypothetical protein
VNAIALKLNIAYATSPRDKEELFNLRHSQARNVIERIFGVVKRRFQVLISSPEYPIKTQVRLVPALAALHNFVSIYDPVDEFDDITDISTPKLGVDNADDQTQHIYENEEASHFRDRIAGQMWLDYQRELCERQP